MSKVWLRYAAVVVVTTGLLGSGVDGLASAAEGTRAAVQREGRVLRALTMLIDQ